MTIEKERVLLATAAEEKNLHPENKGKCIDRGKKQTENLKNRRNQAGCKALSAYKKKT